MEIYLSTVLESPGPESSYTGAIFLLEAFLVSILRGFWHSLAYSCITAVFVSAFPAFDVCLSFCSFIFTVFFKLPGLHVEPTDPG